MTNYIVFGVIFFISLNCYGVEHAIERISYTSPNEIPKEIIDKSLNEDFPIEDTSIYESVNRFFTTGTLVNDCPVKIGVKWGVINDAGEIIVSPKFDTAYSFEEDLERVIVGDCSDEHPKILCQGITKGHCAPSICKVGYINEDGKLIVPAIYESRVLYRENNELTVKQSGLFREGLAAVLVRVNDDYLYGFINSEGKMVIEPIFENAFPFENGFAMVEYKGKNRKIDKKGVFIEESNIFPEGEILLDSESGILFAAKNHKLGVLSKEGKIMIPVVYDSINTQKRNGKNYFHVKAGNKEGILDETGKVIVNPSEIDLYIDDYSDPDIFVFRKKDDSIGYMNFKGDVVIQPKFFMTYRPFDVMFYNGLADVRLTKNGQEKIINREGNIVEKLEMKEEYLKLMNFDKNERGRFKLGKDIGLVDKTGKIFIPIKYRIISNPRKIPRIKDHKINYEIFSDVYYAYHHTVDGGAGERFTAYNKDGKILFESNDLKEYKGRQEDFKVFKQERINGNNWTYINKSGEYIPDTFFEAASDFNEKGIAIVKKGDRFGLINKKIEPVKLKLSESIKSKLIKY